MACILKNWREAATLLLVAKTRNPVVTRVQTCNFQILMLKRSGKSKFMPKLHVFPGGIADDSDFASEWMDIFNKLGENGVSSLKSFLCRGGPGAFMFSRRRPEEFSKIPSELAFRICAIRETFEESGILLARDVNRTKNEPQIMQPVSGRSSVLSDSVLKSWREKVDADSSQFIVMCKELGIVPDVWSLYEWSNWLTPVLPGSGRRYDTAFFTCVLDYIPNAVHCEKEMTELEWASASEFLLKHDESKSDFKLAPPQILELSRILHFVDAEKLRSFSWERSATRAHRFFPVTCRCDDGLLFLYPGDDLYPEVPDFEGENDFMTVSAKIEELRIKHPNMNRSEIFLNMSGDKLGNLKCNVQMSDGQVAPLMDLANEIAPHASL
ncbi:acyl-coenzyme A diphosphatase NUDT19-like [Dreissena polymorpha]|uniref:Nudix hydrolase domain-containing protein n=1 Tax=Dreissena polymorpha TaxID=45954 RepID=A0A9D4IIY5_DREPO|nr:acyl-coenzyme A diphosphatase NUDT19-like [Dreissena polymorpha]KAH3774262.1 hypothetical protein DPMN_175638 [Dreissena polymorpha]